MLSSHFYFLCRKIILYPLALIILYLYVYAPPFKVIPFGVDKPIFLVSILYITYKNQWIFLCKLFQGEFLLLSCISCLSLFIYVLHREDSSLLLYDILLLLECIPCSYFLYRIFEGWNLKNVDNMIIGISIIGAVISTYLLINPELTYFTKTFLLKYPENLVDKFLYRGYGIADGLLFSYPVIQGFCFSFILVNVGGKKNLLFKFSLIFMFISIFANARSGFVPLILTLILMALYDRDSLLKYIISITLISLLLSGVISTFLDKNEMLNASLEWSKTSFDIFIDFINGEKSENVEALLDDMIVYPSSIDEWLLGSGRNIFTGGSETSDIGYFIRLNYGGIVYIIAWFFLCAYMYRRVHGLNRGIALILFISLIYLNYKGDFFVVNPGSRFFFLIYTLIVIDSSLFANSLNKQEN